MKWWPRSKILTAAVIIFALYFPLAAYLKYSYVPIPSKIRLNGPYASFGSSGFAYVAVPPFGEPDSGEDPQRSPLSMYENDRPLGPGHSLHNDIATIGQGRFSHWKGIGIVFSTSDNSDPNTNGRRYFVSRPLD